NLAPMDALQLFMDFSQFLPIAGEKTSSNVSFPKNVFWHARIHGTKLGTFDLDYNSDEEEQVSIAQSKTVEGATFFDIWSSFSPPEQVRKEPVQEDFDVSLYKIRATVNPPTQLNGEAWLQLNIKQDAQRTLL